MEQKYDMEYLLKLAEQRERTKKLQKEWKEKHPEKQKEYSKRHYTPVNQMTQEQKEIYLLRLNEQKEKKRKSRQKSPEKYLLDIARRRAESKGMDFSITEEDIPVPKVCPVLGIELCLTNDKIMDNSPSLDRLDQNKGYIKGNVMVMSFLANSMKRTATAEQLIKFADWIYSTFE